MTGTKLYNQAKQQIYPISHAAVIQSEATGALNETVESNLKDLWKAIADLTGDSEAVENISVVVSYYKGRTNDKEEIKLLEDGDWYSEFSTNLLPDSDNPYLWKKTVFTYKGNSGQLNKVYEIAAVYVNDTSQTIYTAKTTGSAPVITYPILKDGFGKPILDDEGKEQEDLTVFDNSLPEGWLETPVSVSPSTPYVFMATRKKVDGLWGRYSNPAQYGRWAFDSQLEVRYTVTTGDIPTVNSTSTDPGSIWSVNGPTDFTGKLWMITATSVNNVLNAADDGTIWHGPNLLSIIQ